MMDAQLSPPHAARSGPWTLDTCSTAALQLSTTHLTAVDTEEVEQPTVPSTHYYASPLLISHLQIIFML